MQIHRTCKYWQPLAIEFNLNFPIHFTEKYTKLTYDVAKIAYFLAFA